MTHLVLAILVFAAGPGSVPSGNNMSSPHEEAVRYYNAAERRLEKMSKVHADLKAATDPKRQEDLRAGLNKGLETAAADFRRATDNDPHLFQAYSELGFTLRKLGRYDESLAAYEKALAIEPGFSPALEYRAEAYLGLGRLDDVKSTYMTLFDGDRPKADVLMTSMNSWLAQQKTKPTVEAAQLDAFAKWVDSRQTIAGQVPAVASADTFRSW
jgi:tetratricopeptide (TPR) repeat protein